MMEEEDNEQEGIRLEYEHIRLMSFVKDEQKKRGTCHFDSACEAFGKELVLEVMMDYALLTYDNKQPLGLTWTDAAEKGLAQAVNDSQVKKKVAPIEKPNCDDRILDTEDIPKEFIDSLSYLPSQQDIDGIAEGNAIKIFANNEFIWALVKKVKSGSITVLVTEGTKNGGPNEVKKGETLTFCHAHVCDIL